MSDAAAASTTTTVTVQLRQQQDYQFRIAFGGDAPDVLGDEPAPLGQGQGPSPVQLLAAAVGNCLSDSLLFALRKFKQAPEPIACEVHAEVGRNAEGRVRVLGMQAVLTLGVPAASLEHLDRVLASFEGYCTVTQSVRQGIPVQVTVRDADGQWLTPPAA
ncbi:OsmC family protein [Aquabacterium sp.]|uniref:OsmC family protein n=1 Tax=Aquabacterium sp. TaxID=1872578 RepID=UPI0025B8D80A|nr:OsmC family protein [Aquabacterium sp.]